MIAEYLLTLGHTRIGIISGIVEGNDRARERFEGASEALAKAGIDLPRQSVVQAVYSISAGRTAFAELLRRSPHSAVICGNDVLAIGAIQEAQALGIDIPTDISITGFDDMEIASVVTPSLTTLRFPIAEVGVHAARLLVESMQGTAQPRCVELPLKLVVRDSTAPPHPSRPRHP